MGRLNEDDPRVQACDDLINAGRLFDPKAFTAPSSFCHTIISEEFCDLRNDRLNYIVPRGHAKSTLVACFGIMWHIFLEDIYREKHGLPNPFPGKKVVVLISKSGREAKKRLQTIKSILGSKGSHRYSKEFRHYFGHWGEETAKIWNQDKIELKNGTVIACGGTGVQVRGTKEEHLRPTLIVFDDPEDKNNTITDDQMEKNRKFLLEDLEPSTDRYGRIVVIGTPVRLDCLVLRLHGTRSWKSVWLQNDLETETSKRIIQTDEGAREQTFPTLLWPEHIDADYLEKKLDMSRQLAGGESSYRREYEAKAESGDENPFDPNDIRYWDGTLEVDAEGQHYLHLTHRSYRGSPKLEEYETPIDLPVSVVIGIDPAASTKEGADFSVIMPIATDKEDNIYVLNYLRKRMKGDELLGQIVKYHKMLNPRRGIVEATAQQGWIADLLWSQHQITYFRDQPLSKKKGEWGRIDGLQVLWSRHKIYLRENQHDLRTEIFQHPFSRYDDCADALEKAIRIKVLPYHNVVKGGGDRKKDAGRRKKRRRLTSWKTA